MKRFCNTTALAAVLTAALTTTAVAAPQFVITRTGSPAPLDVPGGTGTAANNFEEDLRTTFGLDKFLFGSSFSIAVTTSTQSEDALGTFVFEGKEAGFTNNFLYQPSSGPGITDQRAGNDPSNAPSAQVNLVNKFIGQARFDETTFDGSQFSFTSEASSGVDANFGDDGFALFIPGGELVGVNDTWTTPEIFLGYDDAGAGPDDNHDDYIVSITLSERGQQIPVPASLALLGGGLLGLGVVGRLRSKNAKA